MPVRTGKDSEGCYAQWGSQKKYRYKCGSESGRKRAKQKAHIQGAAVEKSGWKEDLSFEGRLDAVLFKKKKAPLIVTKEPPPDEGPPMGRAKTKSSDASRAGAGHYY
jgi:hypothetical protein